VEEDELDELDEELDELDDDELEDELEDEPSRVPPQPVKPAALAQTARETAMRAARERDSLNINDLAEIMWGIRVYTYAHDYCGKNRTNPRAGGSYSPEAQHVLVLIFVM
jgi:hypothetical protein